ncbi:Pro-Pol polyprotein, partial [Nosema granulosis]
ELFSLVKDKLFYNSSDLSKAKVFTGEQEEEMKIEVENLHASTHYGQKKMEEMCSKMYFSVPRRIVRQVVNACLKCTQALPFKQPCSLKHVTTERTFERFQMDLVDLSKYEKENEGYKWIMTVLDCHSKFAFAAPLKSKSADEVTKAFKKIVYMFGPPEILHTDNGLEFKNKTLDDLCASLGIRRVYGKPRHPQSQGQIERFNQTLTRYLSKHLYNSEEPNSINKDWVSILEQKVYEYNTSVHSANKKSPFQMMFRRNGYNDLSNILKDDDVEEPKETEQEGEPIDDREKHLETDEKKHRAEYLDRMDKSYAKRVKKEIITKGDIVLTKIDYDNNPKTIKKNLIPTTKLLLKSSLF